MTNKTLVTHLRECALLPTTGIFESEIEREAADKIEELTRSDEALTRVWQALEISKYTGKAVWEHVAEVVAERKRLQQVVDAYGKDTLEVEKYARLENPSLRKKLFNAAAAVSGYFDAEKILNYRLTYNEQLTLLARLIARELDVAEKIP